MSELADALIARVQALESRLAHLEALEYVAQADLLDGLHAATSGANAHVLATGASGQTQLDGLLSLLSQLRMTQSGQYHGVRFAYFSKNVADNTATTVFTVTTKNETGDNDAGNWAALVLALVTDSGFAANQANNASRAYLGMVTRSMQGTGTGVNSAIKDLGLSDQAANNAAARSIDSVAMSVVEVDEYNTAVKFTVDHSGTGSATALYVTAFVTLVHIGFWTPPTMA